MAMCKLEIKGTLQTEKHESLGIYWVWEKKNQVLGLLWAATSHLVERPCNGLSQFFRLVGPELPSSLAGGQGLHNSIATSSYCLS